MAHCMKTIIGVLVCLTIPAILGCRRGPSRVLPPGIDASAAGSGALSAYDTDGNGEIAGEELDKSPALKAALKEVDTDTNGSISGKEVTERVQAWQESKLGLMSFTCIVTWNGEDNPLEGATVKFVPEVFLGSEIKAAEGLTDEYGSADMSIPITSEEGFSGLAPGFYLVEITHPSLTIPSKYNTETTLGQEIAEDAADMQEGVYFHISSN